jgi:hypothetical protein
MDFFLTKAIFAPGNLIIALEKLDVLRHFKNKCYEMHFNMRNVLNAHNKQSMCNALFLVRLRTRRKMRN